MKKILLIICCLFVSVGCVKKEENKNLPEITENGNVAIEPVKDISKQVDSIPDNVDENITTSVTTTESTSTTTTIPTTSTTTVTTTTKVTTNVTTKKKTTTTKKKTTTKKTTTKAKITTPVGLTEEKAYEILLSLKKDYPEGKTWDDNTWSDFHGGNFSGGWGCVGFTYMASDKVFGNLPVRRITDFSKIRVGDIFRYNNGSYGHSVIVLEVKSDRIVVVEGNWQKKVHWNREITFDYMKKYGNYIYTRWP